jgi:endonuclease III-like uncharacterized protein
MKLDTKELKMAYFMGWLHALASEHAKEFNRDKQAVVEELLEQLFEKKK